MNTRRRWYIATGLAIVALILATDPFTILDSVFRRPIPVHDESTTRRAAALVSDTGAPAATYLAESFNRARVVFLGEFPQIAEHPEFLADSIPSLAAAGVRSIALEQLRSADQREIDEVTGRPGDASDDKASPEFDTATAEELLFRRDVTWGFQEYRAVLRAAWEHNRTRPNEQLRIRGLAIARNPESTPSEHEIALERHMAQELANLLRETDGPVLVYTSARRAIPRVPDRELAAASTEAGSVQRLAVWAAESLDVPTRSVLLHAPWPEQNARYGLNYPAAGLMDSAVFSDFGANPPLPWGFDVRDTTLEGTTVDPMDLRPETESTTLGALMDGYIVLAPLSELNAATPIPNFVTAETAAEAVSRYPGDIPDSASAEDINSYIARTSENLGKILDSFRNVD